MKAWAYILSSFLLLWLFFWVLPSVRWETSEDLVSGIVYNNTNNAIITGNTEFKIRASAEMNADKNTSRTYCLPPNSKYIPLVKEAAANKNIKLVVTTKTGFYIAANPLACVENVIVTKENN